MYVHLAIVPRSRAFAGRSWDNRNVTREPNMDWAARVDGEIILQITGPDAEAMVRAVAAERGGVVAYRIDEPPNEDIPYTHFGPWIDVE